MKTEIKAINATGSKVTGEILFLGTEEIGTLTLQAEVKGKIIAGGKFNQATLKKALVLDVAGVIATEVDEELFKETAKGVNWEIGETCCLTLTFLIIEREDLDFFKDNQGKKATADPAEKKILLCL